MGEGSSGTKRCPTGHLFPCGASQGSLGFDPGSHHCGHHPPQHHRDSMLGGHGEEWQDEGCWGPKVLKKVGDTSPWLQGVRMLRDEDSMGFEVPESPPLDAWCHVLGLGPRQPGRSRLVFGRQWIFTPELYLITAGTLAGSSISSTVLVLFLSGSSCIRCSWLCTHVIFSRFHLNLLPPELL